MAYTKIKVVKSHLERCLDYTSNPHKTVQAEDGLNNLLEYAHNENKTEHQFYVAGFNCEPETAYKTMMETKQRWGRNTANHVMGYQIIQSFEPGEVTPEQAFEIGCEFARRYLADKYECTVSTHVDRKHLHCHIVFNSTSFVDGSLYRNTFKDYFQDIRRISDELCQEHRLSIIEPTGRGKPYWRWKDDKNGVPNIRALIQEDMQAAMSHTSNWNDFLREMQRMGYAVGRRANTYTFRPPSGQRNIRMTSLEPKYREQAIRDYFAMRAMEHRGPVNPSVPQCTYEPLPEQNYVRRYKGTFPIPRKHKVTGFMALYYHYCHLLGRTKVGKTSKRYKYLLCDEIRKFDRYQEQCHFLWEHHIETDDELSTVKKSAEKEVARLTKERKQLYNKREDDTNGLNKADLTAQIDELTGRLKQARKSVSLCKQIEANAQEVRENLRKAEEIELEERQRKERETYEPGRRSR